MKDKYMNFNKYTIKYIYNLKLIYPVLFVLCLLVNWIILLDKGGLLDISETLMTIIIGLVGIVVVNLIAVNLIMKDKKIEHIFLNVVIPIGLCYSTFILPNFVPDEASHSYRMYTVSQGHILTQRNKDNSPKMVVPKDLIDTLEKTYTYKDLSREITKKTNYNELGEIGINGTGASNYPFVSYLAPAVVMRLCSISGVNIYISYYMARLAAFILSISIIYFAIKILPIGKIVMLVYVFNPMFIQQIASISADCLVNSISMLIIALILQKAITKTTFKNKEYILITILLVVLSAMKYAYFPLSFLLLTLCKKGDRKNNLKILLTILLSFIMAIGMYLFTANYYQTNNTYVIENGIDGFKQISFILHNPFQYARIILNTLTQNASFYFFTMLGRNLGTYTIQVAEIIPILYSYVLLFSPFVEKNKFEISVKNKIITIFSMIAIFILIETGLYIVWSQVGAPIIEGVHGRYFLPFVILIPLMLIKKKNHLDFKYMSLATYASIILLNIQCIFMIVKFFNY